jgi:prephenate dehydratase
MEKDEPQQNRIQNAENRSGKLLFLHQCIRNWESALYKNALEELKALNVEVDFLGNYKEFFLKS